MNIPIDSIIDYYKPRLERHFMKYIPNTAGITATQYIQASLKLQELETSYLKFSFPSIIISKSSLGKIFFSCSFK